jgi:hypothetical protein
MKPLQLRNPLREQCWKTFFFFVTGCLYRQAKVFVPDEPFPV